MTWERLPIGLALAVAVPLATALLAGSVRDPDFRVDWPIVLPVVGVIAAVGGSLVYVLALIMRRSGPDDRRWYSLAGLAVLSWPAFFALVTRSVIWFAERAGMKSDALVVLPTLLGLCVAMGGSASAAFMLPIRSTRERGFAMAGGAVIGFAAYLMILATTLK